MDLHLRPATSADAPRLAEVVAAAYGHYVERLGRLPGPMSDDYARVVAERRVTVAERDGRIVGLIVVGPAEEGFLVDNVAVDPSQQGSGVGRALLQRAEADAREAGFDSVYLFTHELMVENQALYGRVGYVEYDRRPFEGASLVYMRKSLGPARAGAGDGGRRSVLTWRPPAGGPGWAASRRAAAVLADPQGFGNYMTYRDAYRILGWDPREVYRDGRIALDRAEWADLGWMANHLGPSPRAVEAIREAVSAELLGPYSPDLSEPLRDLMAQRLLGRRRDDGFEVIGTEGAQAGVGYAALACLDPGDEVIITDPGYFHFVPALRLAGAEPVAVPLSAGNGWRLDPDAVAGALTPRTKMVVVCDPINPFGTVQRRDELEALLRLSAQRRLVLLSDTTHSAHRVDPVARHLSLVALAAEHPEAVVLASSGLAHGYGMAGARLGALGGPRDLVRACLQVKIAAVRLNTSILAQAGAAAALTDDGWQRRGEEVIRRNLAALKAVAPPLIDPEYGFSCVVGCAGLGSSAQEIMVALAKRKVAVYPGDGLGEVGATSTIRLNLSDPEPRALERFAAAWPEAVVEASTRIYRDGVLEFFRSAGTERAARLATLL